ncbi:hypothetical protein [Kitasatospora sp. DSM 101779]|uniref:hypothetical protein n=1 Tax=Kitasatospora sp. DSM 101779 TaxID=2853165 RepID=UPI0021DABFD8|nr:hypothetical protein [Kitasatospora sp. DSM 101779]MCU7820256.1 hypothetical protein [Kitasatospora sp. DSM 101779]
METDPSVRLSVLPALGEAAADPRTDQDAATAARAVLADVLCGDDAVMWVAAVYASAGPEPDSAVRHLDRLVEVFSDAAVRPRFEDVWFVPDVEGPCSREIVLWRVARLFEHAPASQLSLLTRVIEAGRRTGDALLCREAMDPAWRLLVDRPSVGGVLLSLAGELLDDPDGAVRLRAVNMLAAPQAGTELRHLTRAGQEPWALPVGCSASSRRTITPIIAQRITVSECAGSLRRPRCAARQHLSPITTPTSVLAGRPTVAAAGLS